MIQYKKMWKATERYGKKIIYDTIQVRLDLLWVQKGHSLDLIPIGAVSNKDLPTY